LTQFFVTFDWKLNGICVLNNPQIVHGSTCLVALGLLILEVSVSHTDTLLSVLLLSLDVSVSHTDTLLSVLLLSLDVSLSHTDTLLSVLLLSLDVSVSHTDTLLSVLLLSLDVSESHTDTLLSVLLLSLDVSVSHTDTLLSVLLLSLDVSVSHTDTLFSVLLLSKSGRPLAETVTRQRIQDSQETHIYDPWRDSNLQWQQAIGHRPTAYIARTLELAVHNLPQLIPAAALTALMKYKVYVIHSSSFSDLVVTRRIT
jgi:hypothetical protein